jgi:hypothetical protein
MYASVVYQQMEKFHSVKHDDVGWKLIEMRSITAWSSVRAIYDTLENATRSCHNTNTIPSNFKIIYELNTNPVKGFVMTDTNVYIGGVYINGKIMYIYPTDIYDRKQVLKNVTVFIDKLYPRRRCLKFIF